MNPLFIATASEPDIERALRLWPELAGRRIRPLLVFALGDIYVETDDGDVLLVDVVGLECTGVADSASHLEQLFSNPSWATERLVTELLLLAEERGITRAQHQVFAIAPHPLLSGRLAVENLVAMDLHVWHHICAQLRGAQQALPGDARNART